MTAQPLETEPNVSRPIVVTRRWDQLGGRLSAMVNALSMAELLGLEFRFVWPRGSDPAINDARRIFTPAFLAAFEIDASELEARAAVPHRELLSSSRADAEGWAAGADWTLFIDVDENSGIVQAGWESKESAAARYRGCWLALDWCAEVGRLKFRCDDLSAGAGLTAVHVRAGDIVIGDWRQVLVHEKYLPTGFVEHAIERLADGDRHRVLVMSDHAAYLAWLGTRFPTVVGAEALLSGYGSLSELQQALADIFLMAGCEQIVGPPNSAFSRLAANLGARTVVRADEMTAPGAEREILLASIAEHRNDAATTGFWRGLLARDICWCLDVFADALPLAQRLSLAREAVRLDPEFAGAAARLARTAALCGPLVEAEDSASRALVLAEPVERCADALFEALATDVAVKCLSAARAPVPTSARLGLLNATRRFQRWEGEDRDRTSGLLGRARASLNLCVALHPYWSVRQRIFDVLRSLIAAAERICLHTPAVRRRMAKALARCDSEDVRPERAPFGGLHEHRSAAMYDPLLRDLSRIAGYLTELEREAETALAGRTH